MFHIIYNILNLHIYIFKKNWFIYYNLSKCKTFIYIYIYIYFEVQAIVASFIYTLEVHYAIFLTPPSQFVV